MKKPTKKTLRNKLDRLFSLVVRGRGKCEKCGSKHELQTAHIFSRTYNSTRWDLDNALCLCVSCHFFFHKNPILFGEFVKEFLPENLYEVLKEKRNFISKYTIEDLQIKLKVLQELLD